MVSGVFSKFNDFMGMKAWLAAATHPEIPGLAASAQSLLEMWLSGPTPGLQIQNLHFHKIPGDSQYPLPFFKLWLTCVTMLYYVGWELRLRWVKWLA